MKKLVLPFLPLWLTCMPLFSQVLEYRFNNNFSESCGLAPPLQPSCNDYFYTDTLPDMGNLQRTVHHFGDNCGITFDNSAAGNWLGQTYSIEMYFKIDTTTNFSKILDFKNLNSDYGIYCTENVLQFYNGLNSPTPAFASGTYAHLLVTRDSATQLVREYVNGQFLGEFTDATEIGIMDTSNVLVFFQDDIVFSGEANPGSVALIRLYQAALDSAQAANTYAGLLQSLTPNGFSVNKEAQCLQNNLFSFANTSPDSVNTSYLWTFGDGDSSQSYHAQHTYLSSGSYEVVLLASSGPGCSDTVKSNITVYIPPSADLGTDTSICNGSALSLDPGTFSGYVWNDGSTTQTLITSQPGEYWVQVTDASGCTAADTIVLGISPLISLGPDSFFCGQVVLQLDAGGGFSSYLWNDGSTLQTLAATDSGSYIVTVTDGNGCQNSDTVYFGIEETPPLFLGNDTAICAGSTLTLDAGPFYSYLWQDSSVNQIYQVTTGGTYAVAITGISGCSSYDTIAVTVHNLPSVDLGGDSIYCGAVSATLDAGTGFSAYLWNDGSSLQTLQASDSGMYMVTVTDTNGCEAHDMILLGIEALPVVFLGNDTGLCSGASLLLDAGLSFNYLWQDGSMNQTYLVTGSGDYHVTVTNVSGCSNTDTITVTVHPAPSVSLGDDSLFCGSISLTLDAGAGFSTYSWSDGSTLSTLSVGDSGTYSVLVTDLNGCTGSDTIILNITTMPLVSLGNDTIICDGSTLLLDAGAGFISYVWQNGGSLSTFLASDSGVYSVLVTDSFGCTASDTIAVSLLPALVVSLGTDTAFCFGGSVILDAGPGFTSYLWSDFTTLQTLGVNSSGTYAVTVTGANGCQSTDSITVTVNPLPITPIIFITGGGTTLTSDQPTGNQWYDANGPIAGATGNSYVPTQAGSYYVIVTDSIGCQSFPSNTIVFGLGIGSPESNFLSIYPNPVNDKLVLVSGNSVFADCTIRITDIQGRILYFTEIPSGFKSHELEINLTELQPGTYLLQLSNNRMAVIKRFTKQ